MCSLVIFLIGGIILPAVFVNSADVPVIKDWWETASLYQIYPRSFKDSNGDGIGDIKGITQMLPYLKEIGVTGTWLSPIFKSPMADFGYDISDFYSIQPEYGTMADFDELIATAKKIGIKIILDFVPNHSSDENDWFIKSLNKTKGFEDFYVWHPGFPDSSNSSNRLPPTNWISVFRKPAWTWREERKAFYLHQFVAKQPDLNYRNPAVVTEMKNILTFWLKRNVDGFRIDAVPYLFEKAPDSSGNYPNEPLSGTTNDTEDYNYLDHIYTKDLPETVDMVYQWRELVDQYKAANGGDTRILLTESYSPLDIVMQYYGNGTRQGSHIPFNFLLIEQLNGDSIAPDYVKAIKSWMDNMPAGRTANWVLGNHDQNRVASRFGIEKIDLLNMILMVLPGVGINYNGEEIGMTDVWISWKDTVDPQACNTNANIYERFTRDVERTPFQWDDSTNAGFSSAAHTWLPVGPTYRDVNVQKERKFVNSHLNIYKRVKALRESKTLQNGDLNLHAFNDNVLGIVRTLSGDDTFITVANVGSNLERIDLNAIVQSKNPVAVAVSSNISPRRIGDIVDNKDVILLPNEALVLRTKTV